MRRAHIQDQLLAEQIGVLASLFNPSSDAPERVVSFNFLRGQRHAKGAKRSAPNRTVGLRNGASGICEKFHKLWLRRARPAARSRPRRKAAIPAADLLKA
jgi:hypothetical protein